MQLYQNLELLKIWYTIRMGDRTLGKNLKEARKKSKLTQQEVADRASIHVNYYARLERGEENASVETLKVLFKILKIKIPYPFK